MTLNFERVAGPFALTEGPVWDGEAVLFTDIPNSRIMRYHSSSGQCTEFQTATNHANGLMFDRDGRLYACEEGARRIVRYDTDGRRTVLADCFDGKRFNSPNDLAFDALGRLWFTDPRYGDKMDDLELDHQSVYRLDPLHDGGHDGERDGQWTLTRVTHDTSKPNGILISPDQHWLYVAQSEYGEGSPRELRAYPINDDGTVGAFHVLHNFYPHRAIDGMCLDIDGNIIATAGWQRSGPGPMIYVFAPNGRVLETHPVPVDHPTNCTFGEADLQTLFVTAGGSLYRARTERRGYLVYPAANHSNVPHR